MLKYWVWLSELKGLRNQTKLALLRRFGDPESIFYADPDELSLTEGADLSQLKLLENHAIGYRIADIFRRGLSGAAEEYL